MRIILDTNVVLSASLWQGTAFNLVRSIRQRTDVEAFTSAPLLQEFANVLTRTKFGERIAAANKTVNQIITDYEQFTHLVLLAPMGRVVLADHDDDYVIATAIAARADLIISGDRHLLNLCNYGPTRIINPSAALELLRQ